MPVKFNDHSANERRRNAEVSYRDSLLSRKMVLNTATDGTQSAIISKFPNLIGPKPVAEVTPISTPPEVVNDEQIVKKIYSSPEIVSESELSEQDIRRIAAQAAVDEAYPYEAAA